MGTRALALLAFRWGFPADASSENSMRLGDAAANALYLVIAAGYLSNSTATSSFLEGDWWNLIEILLEAATIHR